MKKIYLHREAVYMINVVCCACLCGLGIWGYCEREGFFACSIVGGRYGTVRLIFMFWRIFHC